MLPHASMNRTQGNALNIPVSAAMYGIFNSQGNTQVNLPVNLGPHTSVGDSNQVSIALQPPANKVAYEAPMSYMQLLLAAEEEGARYASSQSQEDRLVRTENDMYMITGRYSRSSEDPLQAHTGGGAQHISGVDDQHDIELEPFVDNRFSESLNDLNWDNEMQTEAGGNKNGSMVSNEIASDNASDSEDDLSPALLQKASKITVTTAGEEENSGAAGEVQKLTQDDILIFLENDSIEVAQSASQEVRSHHVPHVDMVFDMDDAAYNFYNEYASIAGFSVIKASRYCGKKQGGSAATRVTFKCNRSGRVIDEEEQENRKKKRRDTRQQKTGQEPYRNARKKKANTIAITGCKAQLIVTKKDEKWVITTINLQHNHDLSPHTEVKYLRSHNYMTEEEKLLIRTFNAVKLPTRQIIAILSYLRGGNTPYTKKHVSNVRTAIGKESNQNDMMQVLTYFRKRQAEDPQFYYAFKTTKVSDDASKVLCIFWADGYSRKMYELYGDCLSFDTTFKTNRYNLPFAPFVGVTGHGQNCLFACSIIENETADTFQWLFETFLHCMGGKSPSTIITDEDAGMKTAIPLVFPHICHRRCLFHIKKKAEEKCTRTFAANKTLHDDFSDIIHNSLTVAEFEQLWTEMIQRYNIGHVKYFQIMWKKRKRFVPVYFKTDFFPFIHSTARSEGTNAIFKDNITSTHNVISFLQEYQKISETIQDKEREQDSITRTTSPTFWARSELEIQAAKMYNRKIFYRFQKQIKFVLNLHVEEVERNVKYEVYKTPMLAEKDFRTRRFVVIVNLQQQLFSCICGKFQKDGIVCCHVLRVLSHLNMSVLPEKYYIDRWRPKNTKDIRDIRFNVPLELTAGSQHFRYTLLSNRLNEMASDGASTNRKYLYVVAECERVQQRLDEMTKEDELAEAQQANVDKDTTETDAAPHPDGYGDKLQDPDVAVSKGRPQKGRYKTFMESLASKQKVTCSRCGKPDHYKSSCTASTEDVNLAQREKVSRKQTSASSGTSTGKQPAGANPRRKARKEK
nr:protein FAR1-RELATED SEQUENCE 5-like [Aegilops tauschii subsp. strangulata]